MKLYGLLFFAILFVSGWSIPREYYGHQRVLEIGPVDCYNTKKNPNSTGLKEVFRL